jgi:ankyrin repeat protein
MSKPSVRILEEKKVPEIATGDGSQAKVYVPNGLTPEQWLKIREKTVLAGQLFKEQQYFLALNVVHEMPLTHLLYDYQLILIGLWTYLNLGFYAKAETYCETILKKKDIPGLRRGLLMTLHMQGKYEDALSYTTVLTPEETTEMSKLIQEVHVTFKNKVYPPYICAIGGHTTKLTEFLNHGGNANEIYQAPRLGPGNPSLLYLAAANGQDEVVRLLLGLPSLSSTPQTNTKQSTPQQKGPEKNKKGQTPTSTAKPTPSLRIADVEFENVGWKCIHIASYLGFTKVVSSLLEAKADIHAKMFGSGSDALQLALIGNNITTARMLLAKKANINAPMPVTPNLGIVENFILVPGTTTIRVDALQGPAFWHVAAKGRAELLKHLITDQHIDVNVKNKTNRHASLLHFVTGRGITGERCDFPTVKMLLEQKANPNALTESGYSPLHFACRCGDSDALSTVQELIKYKSEINAITRYNETPLVCALSADNVPIVKELIMAKADMIVTEQQLKQPVMVWSVLQGTNYLVKAILEGYWIRLSRDLGLPEDLPGVSSPNNPTNTPTNPTQISTSTTTTQSLLPVKALDPVKVQQRLDQMAQFVNTKSNKVGLAALHWSVFKGDWVNVGLLLRYGADPVLECEYESVVCTPLKCAQMHWLGKQFGTEIEDMLDCATIIKQAIAIKNGEELPAPVIHDIALKDDIKDGITAKMAEYQMAKRTQQQSKTPEQIEEELDEDWEYGEGEYEGECEWVDDGEGWLDQYEYDEQQQEEEQ